jgi:hypothetical protein
MGLSAYFFKNNSIKLAQGPSVALPPDRTMRVALSDASYIKALNATTRVYDACKVYFPDGSIGINPGIDQSSYYVPREWMRDSTMARMGNLAYFTESQLYSSLLRFRNAAASTLIIPDRIVNDGTIERSPFPSTAIREVFDNGFYFNELVYLHYLKTGSASFYQSNKTFIDAVFDRVPRQNDCCYIPDQPEGEVITAMGIGFNDSEAMTGYVIAANGLQYRALRRLIELNNAIGNTVDAQKYLEMSIRMKAFINDPASGIFDTAKGLFRSATIKCGNQHDIWANCCLVETGLANDANAIVVSQKLNSSLLEFTQKGAVSYVLTSDEDRPGISVYSHWVTSQGVITTDPLAAASNNPYGEYHNGGYWYTPIREVIATLALTNMDNAKKLIFDAVKYANLDIVNQDNVECFSISGTIRANKYAASAGGILGSIVGGGTDPELPVVVNKNAVASYDFSQTSGQFLDSSGNNLHLNRYGSGTIVTESGANNEPSILLDETQHQYVGITSNTGLFDMVRSKGFSMQFLLKIRDIAVSQVIFYKGNAGTLSYNCYYDASDRTLNFQYSVDGASFALGSRNLLKIPYNYTNWQAIGIIWNGQYFGFIQNNVLRSYLGYTGLVYNNPNAPFYIGTNGISLGQYTLDGNFSKLKVYDYAMQEGQFYPEPVQPYFDLQATTRLGYHEDNDLATVYDQGWQNIDGLTDNFNSGSSVHLSTNPSYKVTTYINCDVPRKLDTIGGTSSSFGVLARTLNGVPLPDIDLSNGGAGDQSYRTLTTIDIPAGHNLLVEWCKNSDGKPAIKDAWRLY